MNNPKLYVNNNTLQRMEANFILEHYTDLINWRNDGTESIVDVGCGTGDVTVNILQPRLPKKIEKLVGVDISNEMINFAKSNFEMNKISFEVVDMSKEIDKTLFEQFDHVFSFFCLHWISDQRQAFRNIFSMLKPGGDVLISFIVTTHIIYDIYDILTKSNKWSFLLEINNYIQPFHYTEKTRKEIEKMLHEIGFDLRLCAILKRSYKYPDICSYNRAMIAATPFIKHLPEELQIKYMSDFTEEAIKLGHIVEDNNEKTITYNYKIIVINAIK